MIGVFDDGDGKRSWTLSVSPCVAGRDLINDLLQDRDAVLVVVCRSLLGFVIGLSLLTVPLYTLTLSDSALMLALVVGVKPVTGALLSMASSGFSDYFGYRAAIVGLFCAAVAGCVSLAFSESCHSMVFGQVPIGLADIGCYVAASSLLMELAPPGGEYGLQAPGYLIELAGYREAFLVGGVAALAGLGVATQVRSMERARAAIGPLSACVARYHKKAWRLLRGDAGVGWVTAVGVLSTVTWPMVGRSFYLPFLWMMGFSSSSARSVMSLRVIVRTLS